VQKSGVRPGFARDAVTTILNASVTRGDPVKAKFERATDDRIGIRFEPETFEEQLILEMFARWGKSDEYEFRFSGWEHNNQSRPMREGLTAAHGALYKRSPLTQPQAQGLDRLQLSNVEAVEAAAHTSGMHASNCSKANDHSKDCDCHLRLNYDRCECGGSFIGRPSECGKCGRPRPEKV
jgi:hypothetical protein